ncbi:10316_t:CDS:2 [Entrophospora sp. SA101]|nr:10316_t:CDS:2 [Entrophospora sp. SA101]
MSNQNPQGPPLLSGPLSSTTPRAGDNAPKILWCGSENEIKPKETLHLKKVMVQFEAKLKGF